MILEVGGKRGNMNKRVIAGTVAVPAIGIAVLAGCGSQGAHTAAEQSAHQVRSQPASPSPSSSATQATVPVVSIGHPAQFRVATADNGWKLSWMLNSVRTATTNPIPADEGGGYLDGPGEGNVFLILQMIVRNVGINTINDPVMLGNWQYASASGQVAGSLPWVTTYSNGVTGQDLNSSPVLASGQSAVGYVVTIVPAGKGVIQLIDPLNETPDVQINY